MTSPTAPLNRLRWNVVSQAAVLLLLVLAASGCGASPWSGKCVGVTDGDTIKVMHQGRSEKIRLQSVDCPEMHQAYGTAAKKYTCALAFGRTLTITPAYQDRYGRTVAMVVLPDGRNLNYALVAAGYAWWYRYYAPKDKKLQALEAAARRARLGLWADPHPIPPWEFRRQERHRHKGAGTGH